MNPEITRSTAARTPELLAPAGSFASAVTAYRSGADAVYLGMRSFSARAGAVNFSIEELRRLKEYAAGEGKRIHVALNTVIRDEEIPSAAELLFDLAALEIDAVIVQDYGLLDLIRRRIPELPVHASTQMAVHNSAGVAAMEQLGVSRVILARELSLPEIAAIRSAHPRMELETFIHGAFCYGFSGLCLASSELTGRSGNRGACAQICRTWFEHKDRRIHPFSCNDLHVGQDILRLRDAGVASFKIEGRMKSPEYTAATVACYRAFLNEDPEADHHLRASRLAFARLGTTGFLHDRRGDAMLNLSYPGHLGVPLGIVESAHPAGNRNAAEAMLTVRLEEAVAIRDGALFLSDGNPPRPVSFGIREIRLNGGRVSRAEKGATVGIIAPKGARQGTPLRKISAHDQRLPLPNTASFPERRISVRATCTVGSDGLRIEGGFPHPDGSGPVAAVCRIDAAPERSRSQQVFRDLLRDRLSGPADSRFRLDALEVVNATSLPDDGIFVPLSLLKELKRGFHTALEKAYEDARLRFREQSFDEKTSDLIPSADDSRPASGSFSAARIPLRSELTPRRHAPIPFLTQPAAATPEELPRIETSCGSSSGQPGAPEEGFTVIPLPPVIFDDDAWFESLRDLLNRCGSGRVLLGLNNAAHLLWAKRLADDDRISFFIDYGLYCANRFAYRFFLREVPRLVWISYWIEGSDEDREALRKAVPGGRGAGRERVPLAAPDPSFRPPLFISRVCFLRHGESRSCEDCRRSGSAGTGRAGCPVGDDDGTRREEAFFQVGKRFRLISEGGLSYLFSE